MLKILIWLWSSINILFFIGLGTMVLYNYETVANYINFDFRSPNAIAEFKATYGGAMIAYGLILAILTWQQELFYMLMILGISYSGYLMGRLHGIVVNQANSDFTVTFFISEVIGTIICFSLLYLINKS